MLVWCLSLNGIILAVGKNFLTNLSPFNYKKLLHNQLTYLPISIDDLSNLSIEAYFRVQTNLLGQTPQLRTFIKF